MAKEIAELDFSLDNFHKQKVFKNSKAYVQMIQRLMFMKKGTYPTIPDMGIDISSYRFAELDTLAAGDLKDLIQYQIDTYIEGAPLENLSISTIKLKDGVVLFIDISISGDIGKIEMAMLQRGYEIVDMNIKTESPRLINVPRKS